MDTDTPTQPNAATHAPGIMTLPQAAGYLQLAEKTLLRMAQRGEAPAAKVGSQWRFMRTVIDDWLASQMRVRPYTPHKASEAPGEELPGVQDIFRPDLMNLKVRRGSREETVRSIVEPLASSGFARDSEALFSSILNREMMVSTAIGGGVALPHPHRARPGFFPSPAIAVGLCPEGADFDAPDRRPVYVFFTICATSDVTHVRLMAKVAWLAKDQEFLAALRTAPSPVAVQELLAARAAAA